VKLPGFRPGKIPRRILEQKYRADIEADVVRRVQLNAFVEAIKEKKVDAVSDPQLSGGKLVAAQPFAFTANVEVRPVVSAKDYKGVTLIKFDTAVSDEKVKEQVDRMVQSRVTTEEVSDRTVVAKGDLAVIDFDASIDGQIFTGNAGRDVTVEVIEGQLIEGNLPQLEGAKVGEKTEFDYAFPADYRVDEVKGKTAKFVAQVKAIKAKKMPALDDAFAVTMGAASLEDLNKKTRTDLERAAKATAWRDERENLYKALIEKNPFDLPKAMIERAVDSMLEGALRNLSRQGIDPRMLNLNWESLRDDMRPRAEVDVRGQLLTESIAKQENMTASDEDVVAQMQEMADDAGMSLAAVQKQFRDSESLAMLKNRAVEAKVVALIKQHAKY
jgi:trigger factor